MIAQIVAPQRQPALVGSSTNRAKAQSTNDVLKMVLLSALSMILYCFVSYFVYHFVILTLCTTLYTNQLYHSVALRHKNASAQCAAILVLYHFPLMNTRLKRLYTNPIVP